MKKFLLTSFLFACPIMAMQTKPTQEQLHQARSVKPYIVAASLGSWPIMTIVGGGCTSILGPIALAGLGAKYAYDKYKGK